MPAYYPPSGFKIPWLVMPDGDELSKIQHSSDNHTEADAREKALTEAWGKFVEKALQPTFDYFSRGMSFDRSARGAQKTSNQLLAHEQLKRKWQFEAANAAAKDLGVPLDMPDLHETMGIGTGKVWGSEFCILPHTSLPLEKLSRAQGLYGFVYSYGFLTIDYDLKNQRFSVPYIGLDPRVMQWIAKYGEDLRPLQKLRRQIGMDKQISSTGRNGAQELLWRLRRVAVLGDHDWHHQSTIVYDDTGSPKNFPFHGCPPAGEKSLEQIAASVFYNLEEMSLNTNLKVFETIFEKRPEVKEAILKQVYAFFCELEEMHERALKDPHGNKADTDNCCAYLSRIMLTHLFRMPFIEEDLTRVIPSVGGSIKGVINLMLMENHQGCSSMHDLVTHIIDGHRGPHIERLRTEVPNPADSAIKQTSRFQQALEQSSYPDEPDFYDLREEYQKSPERKHVAAINERVGVNRRERAKKQEAPKER